jgi:integrase
MPKYIYANKYKPINRNDVKSWLESEVPDWVKALMIFLYFYGVRIGEALKVKAGDLYIHEGYLYLETREEDLEKSKDPHPRRLPVSLDSPGMDFLLGYLEDLDEDDYLCTYSSVWCWVMMRRVDPEISSHVFRHNRATEFSLQDGKEIEIQNWLGHSDPRATQKYLHGSGIHTERLGKKTKIL